MKTVEVKEFIEREPHETREVFVRVDVDVGIAEMVEYLQTIPGVRTHTSCQGTIGEGGPHPYPPQVMASWSPEVESRLRDEFDITPMGERWGYLHPKGSPDGCACAECRGPWPKDIEPAAPISHDCLTRGV